MTYLLGQLHFWTTREDSLVIGPDIGCHSYHSKSSKVAPTHQYYNELKTYAEERGVLWSPGKKKPEKLREVLKESEELLQTFRCVYCAWCDRNCLLVMLNNGTIVVIRVKSGVGDIERIQIDKFLVGKLHSDHVVNVAFNDSSILVSYVDPKLTWIQLSRRPVLEKSSKKWEKLASLDTKVSHIDLLGPTGRRLERKLTCNVQKDQVLIWWMSKSDEVWPWTPMATDQDRANVHVYHTNGSEMKFLCCTRTKGDPIYVSYSRLHTYHFHTVEQKVSRKNEISVDVCIYEVLQSKIQQILVTTVPVESLVTCHGMNETEDHIMLGCKDGSLVMYDVHRKVTRLVKANIVPTIIRWHPSGTIVVVGNEIGQLQCYDMALCCIDLQLLSDSIDPQKCLDLSSYFLCKPLVKELLWNLAEYSPKDVYGYMDNTFSLLIFIEKGPLILYVMKAGVHGKGSLSAVDLVAQYVRHQQLDEAVNLLLNMNWNIVSDVCFKCLSLIVNKLLRMKLTDQNEVLLEMTLGSYYSPSYPLSDVVLLEYGNRLRHLARRFFHHLLRYEKFEKAFLLAADVGSRDLFMDIHYLALDKGERILAQAALERARRVECASDSSSMADSYNDSCSSSSGGGSSCSSNYDDSDRNYEENEPVEKTRRDFGQITVKATAEAQDTVELPLKNNVASESLVYKWPNAASGTQSAAVLHQYNSPEFLDQEDTFEDDDDEHGKVHVVHFGIV